MWAAARGGAMSQRSYANRMNLVLPDVRCAAPRAAPGPRSRRGAPPVAPPRRTVARRRRTRAAPAPRARRRAGCARHVTPCRPGSVLYTVSLA